MEGTLSVDLKRIAYAWTCVMPAYFDMCREHTQKNGAGICIFNFLTNKTAQTDPHSPNCIFRFLPKETSLYEDALKNVPKRDELRRYDPNDHILVIVHIPALEGQNSVVGDARLIHNTLDSDGNVRDVK